MKSSMRDFTLAIGGLLMVLTLGQPAAAQRGRESPTKSGEVVTPDSKMYKSFKARSIGPAIMSGRVSTVALDLDELFTFYVGLGTGGLMRTKDNGATFEAIFEKEAVAAVGAIAVSPSNAKQVWVGTGEANDRNSSSWGDGVYRSADGGERWTNVGLKNSKTIARIVVHPTDTNTVWVAAMGDLWNPSPERGLYKTTDGGKTWRAVLTGPKGYTDRVGCGDVVVDPSGPDTLYAALYARRRTPWSFAAGPEFTDGKDLGGIFKSTDGGSTWRKLENGLPAQTGRIGLAIYRKNPKVLYAVVQSDEGGTSSIDDVYSKRGGIFRSDDAGEHWTRVNRLNPRPFYFSQIRVDPENDQRVYVLGFMLHVSDDGGKSFREDLFEKVHVDCHDLVIDPRSPKRLLLGTDGGPYKSFEGGKGWQHLNTMAAGEFYRIAIDMSTPYRIAGGLQDNTNWVGPSRTRSKEGVVNSDWTFIGGGDGFYCVFDPSDSNIVYAESQQGYVHSFNLRTGETRGLRPEAAEGQTGFRFHWNSPLIPSLHHKGTMYLAGNRVFKLVELGEQWEVISPDLSTQPPEKILTVGSGAENYAVVYTLAESPLRAGDLWAGTDDGKFWRTLDEGAHWTDLSKNLPRETRGEWISRVEPSHHDPEVLYMAVDAHRSGSYAPLLYRSADGGKSWSNISSNLPADGPVKVVREGLKNPNLLFAGTEFGLFVSLDRGKKWAKFGELPTVAVDDIVIHPRDFDLVVATHGRSLYIVDDIRPLEEFTAEVQSMPVYLFAPRQADGFYPNEGWVDFGGRGVFRGANPPNGALIGFYVREYTADSIKIEIMDSAGRPVAKLTAAGSPGFGRVAWDLKPTDDLLYSYGGEGKKFVKSDEYTVTLTFGKIKQTAKFRVAIASGIRTR